MLEKLGLHQDTLLEEDVSDVPQRDCNVFVCATSEVHTGTVIFSNYYSTRRGKRLRNIAKIWEVARATSAAPTFFEPVSIAGKKFGDGGTGANNLVDQLWTEASDVSGGDEQPGWKLEDRLQCPVSIGTGKLLLERFGTSVMEGEVLDALLPIATDTENKANQF